MTDIVFKPMLGEPKWRLLSGRCNPRATYARAFKVLRFELSQIGVGEAILEAGFTFKQLRADGKPFAGEAPTHSTVRVTFTHAKMPLSFVCGGHSDWVQNIYLVGMTLERLRAVERYGCIKGAEQYAGFGALPPGRGAIESIEWASVEECRRWLALLAKMNDGDPVEELYREAAKLAHPDVGGSDQQMARVNRARKFIMGGGS